MTDLSREGPTVDPGVWVMVEPHAAPSRPTPIHPADRPATIHIADNEPLGPAIKRICLEQLDRAREALKPGDLAEGIHTARKAMKRIRALLRLCRDEIGDRTYRAENVILRDAARRIAPIRDTTVIVEIFDGLTARYRELLAPEASQDLRARLSDRHQQWTDSVLQEGSLEEVRAILDGARFRYAGFPTDSEDRFGRRPIRDNFASIGPGIGRTYGRGRRAMRAAHREPTTVAYHEWRKRAKYLRYQLETLTPMWPPGLSGPAATLDELGELLGTEHDLAILADQLTDDREIAWQTRHLFVGLASHERSMIRNQARSLGKRLYTETPSRFVSRLEAYWDAWRSS